MLYIIPLLIGESLKSDKVCQFSAFSDILKTGHKKTANQENLSQINNQLFCISIFNQSLKPNLCPSAMLKTLTLIEHYRCCERMMPHMYCICPCFLMWIKTKSHRSLTPLIFFLSWVIMIDLLLVSQLTPLTSV